MAEQLTVVVPSYNGAAFLEATLDSLAAQTAPVRTIVVDDGSTDGSVAIARNHPVDALVLEQHNSGVAAARNHGMAVAATRFVAFLDQDDLWHRDRAARLIGVAEETGAKAVATREEAFALESDRARLVAVGDGREKWPTRWIDTDGEPGLYEGAVTENPEVRPVTLERLMQGAAFVTSAVMYEREAAITAGGCATFVKAADDHVLNVNITRLFGPIQQLSTASLFYRVHPSSTSTVSPLAVAFLTTQLALRHGRNLPRQIDNGPNIEHLLAQVASARELSATDQLALLALSTEGASRWRWVARWAKQRLRAATHFGSD
jgi:glycosyltransferase involved in cell wall biosynthesis